MNHQCQICWAGTLSYTLEQTVRIVRDPVSELAKVRAAANRIVGAVNVDDPGAGAGDPTWGVNPHMTPVAFPCGHAYHVGCIARWCRRQTTERQRPTCPMCQAPLLVNVRLKPWHMVANDMVDALAGAAGGVEQLLPPTDGESTFLGPSEL